jgi:hypothetical protein
MYTTEPRTLQETFNAGIQGLIDQGRAGMVVTDGCFRDPFYDNGGGCRCVIGNLFPAETPLWNLQQLIEDGEIMSGAIIDLIDMNIVSIPIDGVYPRVAREFLFDFQTAHDQSYTLEAARDGFRVIARRYNLDDSIVDSLVAW